MTLYGPSQSKEKKINKRRFSPHLLVNKGTGGAVSLHTKRVYGRMDLQTHSFLISAIDGAKWSASNAGCYPPEERATRIHRIVDCVSSLTLLDCVEMRKTFCSCLESNHGSYVVYPIAWSLYSQISYVLFILQNLL